MNDTVGLFGDEFDLKKENDKYEHELKKSKMIASHFKKSYYHDNGQQVDEFGVLLTKGQRGNSKKPPRNPSMRTSIQDDMSTKSASMSSY